MAQFEDLLRQLQGIIKDAKDGSASLVDSIVEQLRSFAGSEAQKAYYINISDQLYSVHRTFGPVWIHPRGCKCERCVVLGFNTPEYSVCDQESVTDSMDFGFGSEQHWDAQTSRLRWRTKTIPVPFSAQRIAEDVAREINGNIQEGAFVGVFVSLSPTPPESVIAEKKKQYREWCHKQCFQATQKWSQNHDYRFISDAERRAAKELGIEYEWCYTAAQMNDCPVCMEKIRPGASVCGKCGTIVDLEKAAENNYPPALEILAQRKAEKQTQPKRA